MNHTPRFSSAPAAAVALGLLLGSLGAVAATKPEPAAPAPADTITVADVRKLQDTIKGLHERFEGQGKILEKNSDDLGRLTNRVEDYLKPSNLVEPVRTGLAAVVNKTNELKDAQGRLATAQEKQAADVAAQFRELSAALTRLQEQVTKSDQAATAGLAQLRQTIAASRAPALNPAERTDSPAPLLPLLAAIAGATVILSGIILWNGRAQRRAQQAELAQLAATLARIGDSLQAEIQTRRHEGPPASSGSPAAAGGGTDNLAGIRAQLQSLLEHLNPSVPPVQPDEHTTKNFSDPVPDEHPTTPLPGPMAPGISPAACWPASFLDPASPLAVWRHRIESHLASKDHPALPVFSALLALRTLCVRQPVAPLAEVGAAVITLSQALYAYWESLPDLSDDDRAHANTAWIQAVKAIVAPVAPKLEIREIIAGTRFDSDSMQTVQEGPGNHLTVAAVFSWATLDRSGERIKVLQRARIATN